MTILINCPKCEHLAQIPHDTSGKTVRCTGCQTAFVVPPGTGDLAIEWGPLGTGQRMPITPDRTISIGRTKDNVVVLPGPLVSRRHAALKWSGTEWQLHDVGSTNGTFVNGQRVREIGLTNGSRIVIGNFALRLSVVGSSLTDLELNLGSLAEARTGVAAVVSPLDAYSGGGDPLAETAFGHVALEGPDEEEMPMPLMPRRKAAPKRWPKFLALGLLGFVLFTLLVAWLAC